MSYKVVKSCMNCKYYKPWEKNILVGHCERHKDLMTNIFFKCFSHDAGENQYTFNEYENKVVEAYNEQEKLMNISIGRADVFTHSDFLKNNQHRMIFIDSCNNCRYFDQFKDTAFSGKCSKKNAFVVDVLHICQDFITASLRLKIIHTPSKREFFNDQELK